MPIAKSIICKECSLEYHINEVLNRCRVCGGPLDILLDYEEIRKVILEDFLRDPIWHWKYWMFYPVLDLSKKISFKEGGTALVKSTHFSGLLGDLWFKCEGTNPTGSFKDRGTTVEITKAVELGVKSVCCASTGNMGASVAAYSTKAGMDCKIFLPKNVATQKVKQISIYGAEVVKVNGTYADAVKKCSEYSQKTKTYLVGDYSYRGEGEKSIGFEIADQLNWHVPDWIVCPMGNGTMIYSVWDAFNDLKQVGLIDKLPKMIGIQAAGCSPIVTAWKHDLDIVPVKKPKTIASAIECGDPLDGIKALEAMHKSKGLAETVTDREILEMKKELGRKEGIFAESAGAASLAGALKLKNKLHGTIVCVITGNGLKEI